jgi:quercetin dioxygenase-like cupin family protein
MIEKIFTFTITDDKHIERILEDDELGINHMVLPKGEALPLHQANSNVYMFVIRGVVSLCLDDQKKNNYPAGHILVIPHKTRMNVFNEKEETVEIFVVKSPSPRNMA